ncbi:MAG: hypothetical protein R6X02_03850 [Enhygromyxa sp.]
MNDDTTPLTQFELSTDVKYRGRPTLVMQRTRVHVPMSFTLTEPGTIEFSLRMPAQRGQPVHLRLLCDGAVVLDVDNEGLEAPRWESFEVALDAGRRALEFRFEPRADASWPEDTKAFHLGGVVIGLHLISLRRWLSNRAGDLRDWAWNSKAERLELSYDTVEDHHPVLEAPVVTRRGLMRVVQDEHDGASITELIALDNDDRLVHFRRDSSSASGWSHDTAKIPDAPPGKPVRELHAFYEGAALHAFVHFSNPHDYTTTTLALRRSRDGAWSSVALGPELGELLATTEDFRVYRDEGGNHAVFGAGRSTGGQRHAFIASRGNEGAWQLNWKQALDPDSNAQYHLLPGTGDDPLTLLRVEDRQGDTVDYHVTGGRIEAGRFVSSGGPRKMLFNVGSGGYTVRDIIPLPNPKRYINFVIRTSNDEYYVIRELRGQGYYNVDAQRWRLPKRNHESEGQPIYFSRLVAGRHKERTVVFASGSSPASLWVCRQDSHDDWGVTFQPWSELGDAPRNFDVPELMANGPELFLVNTELQLEHMLQDSDDPSRCWHSRTLASPSASATKLHQTTSHALEVRLLGPHDSATSSVPVRIYASRPAVAWINGTSHHLGPDTPLLTRTSMSGKATLKFAGSGFGGTGLTAPRVGVQVPDLGPDIQWMSPDRALHERLAGGDPGFEISKDELRERGLISRRLDDEHAEHVVDAVKRAGKQLLASHADSLNAGPQDATELEPVGWEFHFDSSHHTGVHVRRISAEEGAALATALDAEGLLDADATGLFDFLGDLLRKAANFVERVVKVVVNFVDDTIHMAVHFLDELGQVVLRGASAIADMFALVFKRLAHAFGEIVDAVGSTLNWLRVLFAWDSIKVTKEVIALHVDNTFKAMAHALDETAVNAIQRTCGSMKQHLHDKFATWHQWFEDNQHSLQQLGQNTGREPNPVHDRTAHTAMAKHALRCNFVQHHSEAHTDGLPQPTWSEALDLDDQDNPFMAFVRELERHVTDDAYKQKVAEIQRWLRDIHDINSLINNGFHVILTTVEAVLTASIDVAESVVVLILRLLARAFEWLDERLKQPIEIPVLSQLYRQMIGADMSLLDLVCLGIAVPSTVLYKATHDNAELFTADQLRRLRQLGPQWTKLTDLLPAETAGVPERCASAASVESSALYKEIAWALGFTSSIGALLFVPFDMGMDMVAIENIDTPPLVPLLFTAYQLALHAIAAPTDVIAAWIDQTPLSSHQIGELVCWSVGWTPGVLDVISNAGSWLLSGTKIVKDIRQISQVGPAISFCFGFLAFGTGVASLILAFLPGPTTPRDVVDGIQAVVAPLPSVAKILIPVVQDGPPYSRIAEPILLGVDLLAGLTAAGCQFVVAGIDRGSTDAAG